MHCFRDSQTHGVKVAATAGSWRVWDSLFACLCLSVCVLYIRFCPHFKVSLIIYLHSSIFLDRGQSTRANRKWQRLTMRINSVLFRMRTPVESLLWMGSGRKQETVYVLFWHVHAFVRLMIRYMLEVRRSEELLSSALHRNVVQGPEEVCIWMAFGLWGNWFSLVYSLQWI